MNVELTELTRKFGHTRAVAGVSLEAGPGVFGLLGPNGAGKTSLLRMMATVIPPSSGRLRLLGRDPVIVSTHLVEDVGAACGEVALMGATSEPRAICALRLRR